MMLLTLLLLFNGYYISTSSLAILMGLWCFCYQQSLMTGSSLGRGGICTPSQKLHAFHESIYNSAYNITHYLPSSVVGAVHQKLSSVSKICFARFCDTLPDCVLSSNWQGSVFLLAKRIGIVPEFCDHVANIITCPLPWFV